jgi:RHS repeat-associated protein
MFDPYGRVTVLDGNGTPRTVNESLYGNAKLFCGYRYDQETGLHHTHNRYFSSDLGRFLERNPWGYNHSFPHLYDYVSNRPSVFIEPYSFERLVGAAVGGLISGGTSVVIGIFEGKSARDILIDGASGFVGGAVTGALLTPPPLATPATAGTIGGAVTGFLKGCANEYYRQKDKGEEPRVSVRAVVTVGASTTINAAGGWLAGKMGGALEGQFPSIERTTFFGLKVKVTIESECFLTEGALGIATEATEVMVDGLNKGVDAMDRIINREETEINSNITTREKE